MELFKKFLQQKARPEMGELVLFVLDKSTREGILSQPLQTHKKHFEVTINFLTGYDGIFIVTNGNNKFYLTTANNDDFIELTSYPGAFELEILIKEINGIFFEEVFFHTSKFVIKPIFLPLGSNKGISLSRRIQISFVRVIF